MESNIEVLIKEEPFDEEAYNILEQHKTEVVGMPRENKKSAVWEFYSKIGGNRVKCNLCSCSYKHFGNTSNLITHLKKKHPILFFASSVKRPPPRVRTPLPPTVTRASTSIATNVAVPCTSTDMSSGNEDIVPTKFNQKAVDEALLDMIVLDLQPLEIVENEGFKELTKTLNPDYTLPTRKILSEEMLSERYNICSKALKEKLEAVKDIALTTDIWTSDSNNIYISLTAHFIHNCKLNSQTLSTSELQVDHTALDIAEAIRNILNDWQIYDKVVTVVTDNTKNMKEAITDHLSMHNDYCVAHTLNLAVKDCTVKGSVENSDLINDELIEVIAKCRRIVSHFRHSCKSSYKLKEIQKQMNVEELKLEEDVPTRWNTTLLMLQRLVKIKVPLSATIPLIQSSLVYLDSLEWQILDDCISVLKPMDEITVILSGEAYPTLSCVIPLMRGLQHTIKETSLATDVGKDLQKSLLEVIEKRLVIYESNRTASKATFIDPRFKIIAFGLESNADNAQKWIIEELSENQAVNEIKLQPSPSESGSNSKKCKTDDLWEELDKIISEANHQKTLVSSIVAMVNQYRELPYLDRRENQLQFWEDRKYIFPALYNIACKYLCIPATSVPSERLFSKADYQRRNRLLPKKIDQILFLNSWCKNNNDE